MLSHCPYVGSARLALWYSTVKKYFCRREKYCTEQTAKIYKGIWSHPAEISHSSFDQSSVDKEKKFLTKNFFLKKKEKQRKEIKINNSPSIVTEMVTNITKFNLCWANQPEEPNKRTGLVAKLIRSSKQ